MDKIKSIYKKILFTKAKNSFPLPIFYKKVWKEISKRVFKKSEILFAEKRNEQTPQVVFDYLNLEGLKFENNEKNKIDVILENYVEHYIDVLGSGWTPHHYDAPILGVEGVKYEISRDVSECFVLGNFQKTIPSVFHQKTNEILENISPSYSLIDWHRDFKSGYRFDSTKSFSHAPNEVKLGVDLKYPWEISRLQHLVRLAIFAFIFPEKRASVLLEIKNQILDFIALNPVGIGVTWACPMDVGIRAANVLMAYNICKKIDSANLFDSSFHVLFSNFIYHHGTFLSEHFEFGESITSNHYLSNVVGLVYIAAYLESTPKINDWLCLAVQELENEMQKQFFDEGSNFEGSTSYHRLSTEMMLYAAAIIEGLPEEKKQILYTHKPVQRKTEPYFQYKKYDEKSENILSDSFYSKLYKAAMFIVDMEKTSGEIPQIGDNDSGQFFKLSPNGVLMKTSEAIAKYKNLKGLEKIYKKEWYFDENSLNHGTCISAVNGLFDEPLFEKYANQFPIEYSLVKSLSKNKKIKIPTVQRTSYFDNLNTAIFSKYKHKNTTVFSPKNEGKSLLENSTSSIYLEFGIATYKSDRLYLNIAFGANKKSHRSWGHQHNDKLSIELSFDGEDILVNQGTYLYTPLPERRNEFRSTFNQNVAYVEGEEQNWFDTSRRGLFFMIPQCKTKVLKYTKDEIVVLLTYRNIEQIRHICILEKEIQIHDYCNKPFKNNWNTFKMYSNGYGKRIF